MRTIKLVKPDDYVNGGITCQDCRIPMPVEKNATILEIDWNLISLPTGWSEKYIKWTTALGQGVRRVESKIYYCPECGTKYIRETLPPLPEPTLQRVEEALKHSRTDNAKVKNDSEPPPPPSGDSPTGNHDDLE